MASWNCCRSRSSDGNLGILLVDTNAFLEFSFQGDSDFEHRKMRLRAVDCPPSMAAIFSRLYIWTPGMLLLEFLLVTHVIVRRSCSVLEIRYLKIIFFLSICHETRNYGLARFFFRFFEWLVNSETCSTKNSSKMCWHCSSFFRSSR